MHRIVHNMEGKKKYLHLMAKGRAAEHSESAAIQPMSQEDSGRCSSLKLREGS